MSAHRIALLTVSLALVGGTLQAKSPLDKLNPFSWGSSKSPDKPESAPGPTAKQKADLQLQVGRSLEKEGKLEQAIVIYKDALKNDDHCIEAYQRAAIAHDQLGNFEESDKLYRAALKREPKNAELLCDRGYSFYLQNRHAEAEKSLREALGINPKLTRAHNNLALVLAYNERDEQALAEFAKAGSCEADSRVNLAFCMMARRDWAMARQELQRASAADPKAPSIQQGLAYLRAKAPPEVAETAPTMAAPIMPVSKPAIAQAPAAIVNATPAAIAATMPAPIVPVSKPAIAEAPPAIVNAVPVAAEATMPAPIMPLWKPAITEAPRAIVDAAPAANAATLTSYEKPQSAADTMPCIPATTTTLSELTALSESMSFASDPQSLPAVAKLAEMGPKPAEASVEPASRPSPSTRSAIESSTPAGVPSNAAVPSVEVPAPTAVEGVAVASPQPKSAIRIVDRTERRGTVKK